MHRLPSEVAMLARTAKRNGYGLVDEKGQPRSILKYSAPAVCVACVLAVMVALAVAVRRALRPVVGPDVSSVVSFVGTLALPQPPEPYHYDSFMAWLRKTDFRAFGGLGWKPEVAEFDIDAAAKGKFSPWLDGAEREVAVLKNINKYVLMDDILRTGNLDVIGAPGMHLYILHRLLEAAKGSDHPTFLDAGSGPGYLLLAWVLATGEGSQAIGLDVDPALVQSVRRHSANSKLVDETEAHLPGSMRLEAFVGDAFYPKGPKLGLGPGDVDAVNVGFAVPFESAAEDLQGLADLLRTGGLMAVPVCLPAARQPRDVPLGKCSALFEVFRKGADGALERTPGDPDIPTRFVVALKEGQTTASNQLRGSR